VNELIGVGFQSVVPVIDFLIGAAKGAFTIVPGVLDTVEYNITFGRIKSFADGIFAIGSFRAIHTSAGEQGSQLSDGNAEELIFVNMVDAGLLVGYLAFQTRHQSFGNFPQEHTRLADGVEKGGVFIFPNIFGQQV